MARARVAVDRLTELVRLHRMGTGARKRARLLGMGPNTERRYREALAAEGLLEGSAEGLPDAALLRAAVTKHCPEPAGAPAAQRSCVDAWAPQLAALFEAGLGPRAAFDRLRLTDAQFSGTYPQVKRLRVAMRRAQGVSPEDVAIAVETAPGEVAQVDFGYVGELYDPQTRTLRKAWCFVMVLAYSRNMVARVVFDQKAETWLRLHVEAFEELGGVVATVVPDNLKAAVVRAAFGVDDRSELHRSYRELARHYGFKIDPAPPRAPKKKGKVEAAVKYVKRNFFVGRRGEDFTEVRALLARWVREVAAQRIHGTTGRRPIELFEDHEREALRPLPARPFEPVVWRRLKVHPDCHVSFDGRLYSVPWQRLNQHVWVRATPTSVEVEADDQRIAVHSRNGAGHRSTIEAHLPEHRRELRHRSRSYWEQRAARMGAEVEAYVRELFDSDDVLSQLRTAQAVVTYLERFPAARAAAACARAHHFGALGYGAIKNILTRALDLEPLTAAPLTPTGVLARPRFARNINLDLLHIAVENPHEPH